MKLKVVGSSSHGNCYILQSGEDILLLDCGVPYKEIQKALDFDFYPVVGCLLTHEHNDHAKAVKDIMWTGITTCMTDATATVLSAYEHMLYRAQAIKSGQQYDIENFVILPFSTEHDAADPVGYVIYDRRTGEKLLYATDTYFVRNRFQGINYFLVECNYCLDILKANVEAGIVDETLKNRILQSHFSLANVKDFLKVNLSADTRKIILIHLSDDNSDAARMQREVEELTGVETVVANSGMEVGLDLFPF